MIRIWHSTKTFAEYICHNTSLRRHSLVYSKLYESDANNAKNFHKMPGHIKKILYLDAPDLIVEHDGEPIFTIESSQEAGTGHNAFQRFARIAASVENGVPALYIYPEAMFIRRQNDPRGRWDKINPNIFAAMENMMQIYEIPALLFYFPTKFPHRPTRSSKGQILDGRYPGCPDSRSAEMKKLFQIIDLIVSRILRGKQNPRLINERFVTTRRKWMQHEYVSKDGGSRRWSPETAAVEIDTAKVLKFLKKFCRNCRPEILSNRPKTVIYQTDAGVRGDPYPGALAALDYLQCRNGKTYEDRDKNLVLCWGKVEEDKREIKVISSAGRNGSVEKFIDRVKTVRSLKNRCLLANRFSSLKGKDISRYYMQVRHGCTFTKIKDIRCYAYFADAILFADGALWREG